MSYTVSLTRNPNLSAPKMDQTSPNEIWNHFGSNWWTGLAPEKCPGFHSSSQELHALPLLNLAICSRADILAYFNNTWTLTELLFLSLKNESTYTRSPYHQLRHPLIFYYGHPAVLFLNKMRLAGLFTEPVDLYLEKILETGVDEMSWDDMSKNDMLWPSVEAVHAYRKKIYLMIKNFIESHPDLDSDVPFEKKGPNSPLWSLFMGFEHEKIHFETSSVLIRELPIDLVETPKYWPRLHQTRTSQHIAKPEAKIHYPENKWVSIAAQKVTWGKDPGTPSYGWDNEYGQRTVEIKDSEVTQNLISNGDYYEFVASLAYTDDRFWSQEGLLWRKFRNTKRPTFWVAYGPEGLHDYKLRTVFEIIDMPWDWPAEVNYHEAQAYCRWKQEKDQSQQHYRFLTEAEHNALRDENEDPVLQKGSFSQLPEKFHYNFNFRYASANPVDFYPPNSKGVRDLFGNVWQWIEDQFNPLEGFLVHPLYDDFSTPCFDGKHQMILGGSFISCGHEASLSARFHFRPHFFQHSGFRIAKTKDGSFDNGSKKLSESKEYLHPKRANALEQLSQPDWWKQSLVQPLEMGSEQIHEMWTQTTKALSKFANQQATSSPMGLALDPATNDVAEDFAVPYQASKQFPQRPEDFEKLLKTVFEEMAPLGQQPGHPGYLAYVAGAGNAVSQPAQAIAQTLNQFTAHFNMSPGLVTLETEALKWFLDLFGLDQPEALGLFTTGGSAANLQALAAARNTRLKGSDLSKARFYASSQVHHCIGKALAFLGFPLESLVLIPTQNRTDKVAANVSDSKLFSLDLGSLKTQIQADRKAGLQPLAIIGTAGSTNTGTVDPLKDLASIASSEDLWFHVDGAYGALFYLTEKGRQILDGIQLADSIALDPHKALSLPYGTGCLLVKDRKNLVIEYAGASTYMPPSAGLESDSFNRLDFADFTPELSRDFRGLRVWLPIKTLGIQPFVLNLEEKLKLAEYAAQKIQNSAHLEVVKAPDLSILTLKHKNSALTRQLLTQINQERTFFLSGCEVDLNGQKQFVIRICLLGFRSHFAEVEALTNDLERLAKNLGKTKIK